MHLDNDKINQIIQSALSEDVGNGDITSQLTIDPDKKVKFYIRAREEMIVCGVDIVYRVFAFVGHDVQVTSSFKDGDMVKNGDAIIQGSGNAATIMTAERVALNILRLMCQSATMTKKFVDAVKGTKAKILDTRKTIPGLRILQKYAVSVGGGQNHRFGLYDGILIKDNHISICGSITEAVKKVKDSYYRKMPIEVECDTLEQVQEALDSRVDIILLDNMSIESLQKAVAMTNSQAKLEASGNVNLETVAQIAQTGVDFISAGILTHAPTSLDIGLDMQ